MNTIKATPLLDWLFKESKRINFLYGSAGSGKSYQVALYLIYKFFREKNISILISRKTTPALRMSTYKLVLDLLDKYFSGYKYSHNKTDMIISYKGNDIIFKALDEPSKIRSTEFNYIWLEEASEFTFDDYQELLLRLRRINSNGINQIILTTNPISVFNWIYTDIYTNPDPAIAKNKTTWEDNPFLDQTYIDDLLKKTGNYRKVFVEGEFGLMEGLIFPNFDIYEEVFDTIKDYAYGLDFGYTAPASLIKVMFREDNKFIADELLYQDGLTNAELIDMVKKLIPEHDKKTRVPIYCDTAEPARINEFYQAGFNAHQARKDINAGIDFMIENFVGCTSRSINLIKELRMYSWDTDKNNKILQKPVKQNDHAIDAMRYASFSHVRRYGKARMLPISFR